MCSFRYPGGSPTAHSGLRVPPRGCLSWLPEPPLLSQVTAESKANSSPASNSPRTARQGGLDNAWEAGC